MLVREIKTSLHQTCPYHEMKDPDYWFGSPAPSPPPPPMDQGERLNAWLPRGAAVSSASTPPSRVIAVTCPESLPCVATRITASPFVRSASVTSGRRFTIC